MFSQPKNTDLVAVRWNRPGHRHNNVVHLVSKTIVAAHPDGNGRVIVHWPRKGKEPELWEGVLADDQDQEAKAEDEVNGQCNFKCARIARAAVGVGLGSRT